MRKNNPKISIITPTFNSEKIIEICILSVANQSYKNIEHLVVDGLSTDKTIEIVKKYAELYPHIRWVSVKDEGIYDAMNKGINMASGDWIYFLGADDILFDNNVLDKISENLENIDILYGNVKWGETENIYDGKFSILKLMEKNICHQAIFFKANIFEKLGKFETKYRTLADWALNIKWINDESIRNKYINVIISKYNTNGISSREVDIKFVEDFDKLVMSYFPNEYSDNLKKIKISKKEIEQKNEEIKQKNQEIEEKSKEIEEKSKEIEFMKSSKFWKLRSLYVEFVKKLK